MGSSPSGLLIVTATGSEFRAVAGLIMEAAVETRGGLRLLKGFVGPSPVTLVSVGIGAGSLELLEAQLTATNSEALLVAGLAGGLDPSLKAGDVVVYNRCLSVHGPESETTSIACDATVVGCLESGLRAGGFAARLETGVTVGSMVTKSLEKSVLAAQVGAAAVDMESFTVLAAASRAGLPAGVLRVVLDEAGLDTPNFNAALTPNGRLRSWPLTRELILHPEAAIRFMARLPKAHHTLRRAVNSALIRGLMQRVP